MPSNAPILPDPEPDSRGLQLDIELRDARWQSLVAELSAHAAFVWQQLGLVDAAPQTEAALVLADDATLAQLNTAYRDKTGPTNVLSFPAYDSASVLDAAALAALAEPFGLVSLGDIVISYDRLSDEAAAQDKPVAAHAAHLLTHGLLHLLGHDHQEEGPAELMETLESRLMLAAGFADPYVSAAPQIEEAD